MLRLVRLGVRHLASRLVESRWEAAAQSLRQTNRSRTEPRAVAANHRQYGGDCVFACIVSRSVGRAGSIPPD